EFELVEARDAVGGAWRQHYDRLHLHTPRWSSALPGRPMPRRWERYPPRDRVVEYLEHYQRRFGLRPMFGRTVTRIERVDGAWHTTTSAGLLRSRNVVVATGRTRVPVRPTWPGMDVFRGEVLHSGEYSNGHPWRGRTVLVGGFGNSACEQALDLLERGAVPRPAVRSPPKLTP